MKKTLLITLEYPPMIGGVAHYYQNLVQALPQDRIHVLDNNDNALLSTSRFIWPKWIKALIATWKYVRDNEIEHILVGQILPLGTVALLLYIFKGIPYTVMTHAMDLTVPFGADGSTQKQQLMRHIMKNAHRVTTVSTFTKMQLESTLNVDPEQVSLIYPCPHVNGLEATPEELDTAALDEQYELKGKRVVLTVGRLVQRKGVDRTIEAIASLVETYPDLVYAVVGDGPYRVELERLATHHGILDNILFTGRVETAELKQWYARCELFIMPSRELYNSDVEGFGIVYIEANSFGKPVIGGKSGGVLDAVIDGDNGYLVDPTDIGMIATAIDDMLSQPERAQALGKRGKQRVETMFEWEVQAKKLEAILQ